MSDSADIKAAAEKLDNAVDILVKTIEPLLSRIVDLETRLEETKQFDEDRNRLAKELDESRASLATISQREDHVSALAQKTRAELDAAISEIKTMLADKE